MSDEQSYKFCNLSTRNLSTAARDAHYEGNSSFPVPYDEPRAEFVSVHPDYVVHDRDERVRGGGVNVGNNKSRLGRLRVSSVVAHVTQVNPHVR